jgi:glycosyltransferase involved in cell wall biosynthesis
MFSQNNIDKVTRSPLFDATWYTQQYADVVLSGLDPAEHYLSIGGRIGRDPGPQFSTSAYLRIYPDVAAAGLNALLHYESNGRKEGLSISSRVLGPAAGLASVRPAASGPSDYAVIVHAYHADTFAQLRTELNCIPDHIDRYVSYPEDSEAHDEATMCAAFPGCTLMPVPNRGQDVGAFLQVLELLRNRDYKFFCKIHSKVGDKLPPIWRRALLDGTIGSAQRVSRFEKLFRENSDVMLGGPKELFLHGPSYLMGNSAHMDRMLDKSGLKFDYATAEWGFFAGTFFWIRREVTDKLLACVPSEEFGADEVLRDGQLAHAVERMVGILPTAMGGRIAFAKAADLHAPIEVVSRFPSGVPRRKQGIIQTLREYLGERISNWMDRSVAGHETGLGFTRIANEAVRAAQPSQDYAIITPTGDRTPAFNRCIQMVNSQTVQPREWIIVDDGLTPMAEQIEIPSWATYVRRERRSDDPPHTLSVNILTALEHVTQDKVVIIEDDDWYSPYYAEFILPYLEEFEMTGLNTIRYYHLLESMWKIGIPPNHTAFAQTAFKRGPAWDHLKTVCEANHTEVREKGVVDRYWWQTFEGEKYLIKNHPCLHTGLKGGFGRAGLAEGHQRTDPDYKSDDNREYLRKSIGNDTFYYNRWQNKFRRPFAIYTAVAGGYDNLKEPIASQDNFDFYAFSDTLQPAAKPWQSIPFDTHHDDPVRTAKKPKIMPHLYFPDYEWSLWIDANMFMLKDLSTYINLIIENRSKVALFEHPERNLVSEEVDELCDLERDDPVLMRQQFDRYLADGWDNQLPLYECNFIVRRHNDPDVSRAMTMWWNEISNNSRRDQISFPYSMWKSGITPMSLRPKGQSVRNIPEVFYPTRPPHGIITMDSVAEQIKQHVAKLG